MLNFRRASKGAMLNTLTLIKMSTVQTYRKGDSYAILNPQSAQIAARQPKMWDKWRDHYVGHVWNNAMTPKFRENQEVTLGKLNPGEYAAVKGMVAIILNDHPSLLLAYRFKCIYRGVAFFTRNDNTRVTEKFALSAIRDMYLIEA